MVALDSAQAGGSPLRIVLFGTPAFAVPTLEALLASPHEVVGVVTQPDRPRGRGQKTTASAVKEAATAAELAVLQPQSVRTPEFAGQFASLGADLAVVAAYGQILTDQLLATPRLGMINVHASLLPRYRGAAPVHRALIDGASETGVTIMRLVKALDAGPMMAVERMPVSLEQTSDEIERDLARLGAALLVRVIDDIVGGRSRETPQDASLATYAPRLTKDDGRVDWSWPALRIHNLIRGLHPWPHAATFAGATRLILHRSHPFPDQSGTPPGTILDASLDHIRVATGDGTLDLLEVQAEGKRPLPAREFLAGHPLTPGTILRPSA